MSGSGTVKKLIVTSGDPAGIGPEIIENILSRRPEFIDQVAVVGDKSWCEDLAGNNGIEAIGIESEISIQSGEPSKAAAKVATTAMEIAARECLDGNYSGVVTGPISKSWAQKAGFEFPGQTEFFANRWAGEPTMAFVSEKLRVSLVTWHIPLNEVWRQIDESSLKRAIDNLAKVLKKLGYSEPRIAICGLNPHAGEGGVIGTEEVETLDPWINSLKNNQIELSGSYPADTLFYRHLMGEFDGVVALYHDQALAPIKTVAFHDAVNVTLGLKHVRTSPDHGTAFEIAGKGIANTQSFERAIELALKLI